MAARTGVELRGHLEIADTIYTHVADAEQYGALEGEHVVAELRGKNPRGRQPIVNDNQYDVLGGNCMKIQISQPGGFLLKGCSRQPKPPTQHRSSR
jgi:hypothetical protein